MKLEELTSDEKQLINYYRQMDERGRNRVMMLAQAEYNESKVIYLNKTVTKN